MLRTTAFKMTLAGAMLWAMPLMACDTCGCADDKHNTHAHSHTQVKSIPAQTPASSSRSTSSFKADRQAILAMAGQYRVAFDFKETVAVTPGYTPKDPTHTQATEWVTVIEDTDKFISLQHILVAHSKDGQSHTVKHWRQDWTYQDTDLLVYQGHRTGQHTTLSPEQVAGTWSQAVFQVDDSPRYESYGKWSHLADRSAWESQPTWRPMPRRDATKRDDYNLIAGRNRHTITPAGWVHEQDNQKLVLDDAGKPLHVLVHESGINTYDRDDSLDLTEAQDYWKNTSAYWHDVRHIWETAARNNPRLTLADAGEDGENLYLKLLDFAEELHTNGHAEEARLAAQSTVQSFLKTIP